MTEHSGTFGYHPLRENLWGNRWSCCFSTDRGSSVCNFKLDEERTEGIRPYRKVWVWDRKGQAYDVYEWEKIKAGVDPEGVLKNGAAGN